MDKELKAKWVAALRSDNYQQWSPAEDWKTGTPCGGKLHCCLGVLAEVVDPSALATDSVRSMLADVVRLPKRTIDQFIDMNDGKGLYRNRPQTFEQIADWIEANL